MTVDREARFAGDGEEIDTDREPGHVYLDWLPHEGQKDHSQRVDDVYLAEVTNRLDATQGELVLHHAKGVGVFDLGAMRGFRTHGDVKVPDYNGGAYRAQEQDDEGDEQ